MSEYSEELRKKEKLRKETIEEALTSKDFYDPTKILETPATFKVIFGQRSNGKTYSVLKHCLDTYRDTKRTFVYIRRWGEDVVMKNMTKLFDPLPVAKIFGEGYVIKYWRGAFILHNEDDDEIEDETIGWAVSLSAVAHTKSQTFVNAKIIVLDEFLQLKGEKIMRAEYDSFEQTVSSILRTVADGEIFLLGNTVSRYSEYFAKLGIQPMKLKQGEVTVIHMPNLTGGMTTIAVEWCEFNEKVGQRTSKYLLGSKMATTGEWEMQDVASIPHTENELAKERLLCTIFDFNMKINIGFFVRSATWWTLENENGIYAKQKHQRQFLVIRETPRVSSYYHLTTVKDLTYRCWSDIKLMFSDIKENTGIDILTELKMGRVFAEDMSVADNFYNTYNRYLQLKLTDLL